MKKIMAKLKGKKYEALTGGAAVAEAMRQIDPDVVAAYPITPQTPIIETFAQFVADGKVSTELIDVESEHSALSAVVGASAAGGRAMTATSSQGLALMAEIVYVASGSRLPILMAISNRALSAPINIHCDHNDSMFLRDASWMQFYSENAQEVYDNTLIALKVAENKKVQLPVMVMQDGFITSHNVENVLILADKKVKSFVGKYEPEYPLLNLEKPVTVGPLDLFDYFFEHKYQQIEAMEESRKVIKEVDKEFYKLTGRKYDFIEKYKTVDADFVIVALSSTCGTAKMVVDDLRKKGKKVGLLKIRVMRPFPEQEIAKALEGKKAVAVLDRSNSYGSTSPVFTEVRSALYNLKKRPKLQNYVYGLGGRNIGLKDIEKVFEELIKGQVSDNIKYIGLRK
ncbi:MAG: transketolase C-terminal domain-containing protein [Candidatus Pacebacteria bacterium]|nr:transketolase C-terminal domain-containing protein [Candidatus Paceibacterota bacterium]